MRFKQGTLAFLLTGLALLAPPAPPAAAREATPTMMLSCEDVDVAESAGTSGTMMGDMDAMDMGTPMAGMDHMAMELDQMYIDMMIPHHASIITMAQATLPRLEDERLREIAQAVIATQQPEIEELRGYREVFYGEAAPMPMDAAMMTAMEQMMPGMMDTMPGTKEMMPGLMEMMPGISEEMVGMAFMMNAEAQVAAVCAAENTDLAFIDLTIPHHQMAIVASEAALQQATHPEIGEFAQRVIDAQQREIDELTIIRQELTGEATPASS
ncbi:MAG: DUF305 domain-containing protein [Thermomicrobiales bacterium]